MDALNTLTRLIESEVGQIPPHQQDNRVATIEALDQVLQRPYLKILDTVLPSGVIVRSYFFDIPQDAETDPKPILHLSPGGSRNAGSLVELAGILAAEGIPVCVTDYPGQGFSTGTNKGATIDTMADAVQMVLKTHFEGIPVIVGGHSKGGTVSQTVVFKEILGYFENPEVDRLINLMGYISIASGPMNPLAQILNTGCLAILSAIIGYLRKETTVINFFPSTLKDEDLRIAPEKLKLLLNAFGSRDSIYILEGLFNMRDDFAPTSEQVEKFVNEFGQIAAQLVHISGDSIFPLEDTQRQPGALRRMRRWEELQIGPAGLVPIKRELGHSASTLYPQIVAPFVAEAYWHIVNGTTGEGGNALPPKES
ncbi:MAG: alpha/beta hydrolase [Candidatus Doudnabacteria bacterium]|nr:alpha/beta hydrolase [Candidatus Doudnabacteria bacterium]